MRALPITDSGFDVETRRMARKATSYNGQRIARIIARLSYGDGLAIHT